MEKDCKSGRNFDNETLHCLQEEEREGESERSINHASGGCSRAVVDLRRRESERTSGSTGPSVSGLFLQDH